MLVKLSRRSGYRECESLAHGCPRNLKKEIVVKAKVIVI